MQISDRYLQPARRETMQPAGHVHIFLVESEPGSAQSIRSYLELNNFAVSIESDENWATNRILAEKPDLAILDIPLPKQNQWNIFLHVRPQYHGPIIILTPLVEEVDQILGLDMGADDYIAKPVHPRLLLSKINAVLRLWKRAVRQIPRNVLPAEPTSIKAGRIEITPSERTVLVGGKQLILSTTEFDLLLYLTKKAGHIISRQDLYQDLLGIDYDGSNRTMDVRISRLREKIDDNIDHPRMIRSIRGKGYLMVK
jgi:two-component system response regulator RstA